MEKEILKQILSHLDDFKKEQLILLIFVFIIFILLQLLQAVYTSRLIDRYRNELKKKEMKFSLFNELQVKSLSNLYGLINDIKSGSASIYNSVKRNKEEEVKLKGWISYYQDYDSFLNSNKYILPRKIKDSISENTNRLIAFNGNVQILKEKWNLVLGLENKLEQEQNQKLIVIAEKELEGYNFEKSALEVMLFSERLKKDIEEYFEGLE